MQDWAGWLLMLFSFAIVLMWKHVRSDTKVVHAIWFCMVLHHIVAIFNAYVGTVIGADQDANSFHMHGVDLATIPVVYEYANDSIFGVPGVHYIDFLEMLGNFTTGLFTYTHLLGFFYSIFGASLLLGEELSVFAFTLSCVVLVKLVDLINLRHFRVGIVLLFGLLPSAVIFRSVTLRESWQALFFLLSVYWAIRLWRRPDILIILFMLMSTICLALLHNGLKLYIIYFLLISFYWGIFVRKKGVRWARHIRFLFFGLLAVCVIIMAQKLGWYATPGEALEGVEAYRQNLATIHGRTTYGVVLDTSSVLGLVKTIPIIFAQYMFAPFPWQVGNVMDVNALLESMLRFVLLFSAVYSWRRSSGEVRNYYTFLLIVVLGMELFWAMGTNNWGTALRHRVPGFSIIVLLGAPGLFLFMRELHFRIFGRRKVSGELNEQV